MGLGCKSMGAGVGKCVEDKKGGGDGGRGEGEGGDEETDVERARNMTQVGRLGCKRCVGRLAWREAEMEWSGARRCPLPSFFRDSLSAPCLSEADRWTRNRTGSRGSMDRLETVSPPAALSASLRKKN